jgi:hypothetical protein
MPSLAPLRVKESSKYMLQCSWVTRRGGGMVVVLSLSPFGHEIH